MLNLNLHSPWRISTATEEGTHAELEPALPMANKQYDRGGYSC